MKRLIPLTTSEIRQLLKTFAHTAYIHPKPDLHQHYLNSSENVKNLKK